jgi:hypothetical protein
MAELTGWFAADILPSRKGWYETRFSVGEAELRYFDGASNWWMLEENGEKIVKSCFGLNGGVAYLDRDEAWRGLASDPAKGANHD